MDDFKRANIDFTTGWDLVGCPVYYRPKERRQLMKLARRRARRRLREQDDRALSNFDCSYNRQTHGR